MRLEKLTIGSAKIGERHQFKNLKNVTVDFDQVHWVTVVIGWNGSGKSNLLEALAIIFRDLIAKKRSAQFAFRLTYRMGSGDNLRRIQIDSDPDRPKAPLVVYVADYRPNKKPWRDSASLKVGFGFEEEVLGEPIKLSAFFDADRDYLPRYVFAYYSGESQRMYEVFRPYLENYDSRLRNGEDPGLKRLFYAMPVHSQFVLLAFLIQQSDVVHDFLDEHLGLDPDEGIESVLFVLRQPPWKSKAPDGDPRFWNARGVVREFLSRLYEVALAPVEVSRRVSTSIWNTEKLQFKYLYVKDMLALRRLVGNQAPAEFFRDLESTYVSELIDEVRIRVRLKNSDGSVTFRELSEGEQQLLTVLGLLRFTTGEESLFLLDEPDTHLNPQWSVEYLSYLRRFASAGATQAETSHLVLTTHNPLAIAELAKEQIQIFSRDQESRSVQSVSPKVDPKGMGYAGIVTSDMFGLGSSLDKVTNEELLEFHRLSTQVAPLNSDDRVRLEGLRRRLGGLEFNFASRDRLEQEYLRARYDLATNDSFTDPIITPENKRRALRALTESLINGLRNDHS